jgi:hypothetical protein
VLRMCPEYTEFAEGEGFERLRLPQRLSSATAGIAAPARNSLTSLQFKSLSVKSLRRVRDLNPHVP